jgi:dTDP-4-amino-4,6-dideoxygalactose transaminase
MNKKPIFVTQPSLAPLSEFTELLEDVWDSSILTHNGPFVQRFEKELCEKLSIRNFVTVANGTIALQMAIKALELRGEIITTAFTWIATVSAIKWEGCIPIFCDIDSDTLNIDPTKIEALITKETVAIMPVHVFGNSCDVDAIEKIAKKYNLKVIYDAAHAIGSTYKNRSVLEYGDISVTSLHATKLLNTGEGGGCISKNNDLNKKLKRIRFFGHNDQNQIVEDGFNAKLTEVHAALGLSNLKYLDEVMVDRKVKYQKYYEALKGFEHLTFQKNKLGQPNYSYFPIIFDCENHLLKVVSVLNKNNIFPRRYFYPSVNMLYKVVNYQDAPVSEDVSKRILCLPLYWKLTHNEIEYIVEQVGSAIRNISK